MAVTVLRLSTVAGHAIAVASLAVFGCNAVFTDPLPAPLDGCLVCIAVFPAVYMPGAGRRDKLVLRRTDDGSGSAVADASDGREVFRSEVMTAALLLPVVADDSDSTEDTCSDAPTRVGNLDGTASRYNGNIHT